MLPHDVAGTQVGDCERLGACTMILSAHVWKDNRILLWDLYALADCGYLNQQAAEAALSSSGTVEQSSSALFEFTLQEQKAYAVRCSLVALKRGG
jgi:hypothetical protein